MPRKTFIHTPLFPYHVTARVNNREIFPADLSFVWKTLTNELFLQEKLHGCRIHAFVLMPNHFHLLISATQTPISKVMQELLSAATRIINTRARRTGHLFGGRYHWSVINDPLYYAHALKYVYRNPVKAGLSESVASYRFSTLPGLLGEIFLPVVIHPVSDPIGRLVPPNLGALEDWLNRAHKKEENEAIRKALGRKEFRLPISKNGRKPLHLPGIDAPTLQKEPDTN